ncbi:MAG: AAA family ATPase [Gemmatimonadota bacterium]|nr:AAA family ATPase [Gemmatimonadota bacterium]
MLRLRSLGQCVIEAGETNLLPAAETLFALALYLIMEAGRAVGRAELGRALWPGVPSGKAQHGLRQAIYKLRSFDIEITAQRSALRLTPGTFTTDFAELLLPQTSATQEALADQISGAFLPGYRPQLSEAYATWVERQRDVVHSAVARTLMAGMQAKKRVSDWNRAERLATMCLKLDPLNEEATLTLAEAAALGGSKTKALSILNHYLEDIGEGASEIKLPAVLLRRRISEVYQDSVFPVRDAPFVGRENEMAELTRALARAQAGHGSAYVITGEPGIGKTRLLSEFTRVAALQRLHIVRVGCQSHDVRRPLSVFVDLVPKLLALPGALGCSPESMQLLRRLVAHDPEEARNREEMELSSISFENTRMAICDILEAVGAERCLLLEIEDAQWLDPHSGRLVQEISIWATTNKTLLLATSRTMLLTEEHLQALVLRPLTPVAGTTVARALTSEVTGSDDFRAWCVTSSGGNPFYLIELLRNGTQAGDKYQPPRSLTRLLHHRVSLLSEDAKSLLETCCILGLHSTLERVETCIQAPRQGLLRALAELEAAGMITVDGGRILSRHDVLTSVVFEQMSDAVKNMLHRYAAQQLEAEADKSQAVNLIWESAEHWVLASDSSRAVQLLRRFGHYLEDIGMLADSARVLERAQMVASSPSEKYEIGKDRARTLVRAEQSLEAIEVLEELILLRQSVHPKASVLDEVGQMYLQAQWKTGGSVPELVANCLKALSSSDSSPEHIVATATWLLVAADNLCDSGLATRVHSRTIDCLHAESVAEDSRLLFQMIYHSAFGDGIRACDLAMQLVEFTRLHSPPLVVARHLRFASYVFRSHRPGNEALQLADEAYQIAATTDAKRAMSSCANAIGSIYMQMGELELVDTWLTRAVVAHAPGSVDVAAVNIWADRAELAVRQGDATLAEFYLSGCLLGHGTAKATRGEVLVQTLEIRISLLRNEPICAASIEAFEQSFNHAKTMSMMDFSAESVALALESVGRHGDARQAISSYVLRERRDSCPLAPSLLFMFERHRRSDPAPTE